MNGAGDQGLAVVLSLQVSGLTSAAATATAGVGVAGLADQHLALQIHRLGGSQKLEGFETEAGVVVEAGCVGLVGAVCAAPADGSEVIVTSCPFQQNNPSLLPQVTLKCSSFHERAFLPVANQVISSGLEVVGRR